jgi:two-component system, LuxR family, response regulator FixJ
LATDSASSKYNAHLQTVEGTIVTKQPTPTLAATLSILPTVFIVDDDDAVRNAVQTLVESIDIQTCVYNNVQSFLDEYNPEQPGCLVLDVRLPQLSGLELQEYLLRKEIKMPIIFVSGHSTVSMAVRTLKAGAIDFLEKPFNDQELLDSIQRALEHDRLLRSREQSRQNVLQYLSNLSRREEEVMRLLIQGKANKVIAHEMNLSTKTVETHRAHIMRKLGLNSLAGLVWMAMTSGEYHEVPEQLPFSLPKQAPAALSLR